MCVLSIICYQPREEAPVGQAHLGEGHRHLRELRRRGAGRVHREGGGEAREDGDLSYNLLLYVLCVILLYVCCLIVYIYIYNIYIHIYIYIYALCV